MNGFAAVAPGSNGYEGVLKVTAPTNQLTASECGKSCWFNDQQVSATSMRHAEYDSATACCVIQPVHWLVLSVVPASSMLGHPPLAVLHRAVLFACHDSMMESKQHQSKTC